MFRRRPRPGYWEWFHGQVKVNAAQMRTAVMLETKYQTREPMT